MTNTEYVARAIRYYTKHRPMLGKLVFDATKGRFVIQTTTGKLAATCPADGLSCGDVYIVQNPDKSWQIAQCELTDDGWKMMGSQITQSSKPAFVLYVPNHRLSRFVDFWVDERWSLGTLSITFIDMLLNK